MRYIVQFRDKTTKRISEEEAKPLMLALAKGKPAILRGAYINPYFIDCIKPVSKDWFDPDYVRLETSRPVELGLSDSLSHQSMVSQL